MTATLAMEAHLIVAAVLAGYVAYIGTNLDNLLLLAALSRGRAPLPPVAVSVSIVVGIAVVLALGLTTLQTGALRWLGLLPLGLGLYGLAALARAPAEATQVGAAGAPLGVVLLSNSGDTLAVLTPLFADTILALWLPVLAGVALGVATMLFVLARLQANARFAQIMARQGVWIAPCVMIVVGLYIILDTPTDTL
ncbi:MAG: hypothetical protein AAGH83_05430 [Pseudomonadota bacterium]